MNPPPHAKKQWTDKLANHVLCDYFYIFFVIFSVMAGISFIGGVYIFTTTKMPFGQLMSVIFSILLSFGVYSITALFLYLICDRALPKDGFQDGFESSEFADAFYDAPAKPTKAGFENHQ
jgi:energy-coupling factor transporter transmembrane protein EcfT